MFTSIAPRYDLAEPRSLDATSTASGGKETARTFAAHSLPPGSAGPRPMLWHGRYDARPAPPGREVLSAKFWARISLMPCCNGPASKAAATPLRWIEADALRLPFPDDHFDLITSAFGFRNLADYDAGLQEIIRVLRPGRRIRHSGFWRAQRSGGKVATGSISSTSCPRSER